MEEEEEEEEEKEKEEEKECLSMRGRPSFSLPFLLLPPGIMNGGNLFHPPLPSCPFPPSRLTFLSWRMDKKERGKKKEILWESSKEKEEGGRKKVSLRQRAIKFSL